MFNIREEYRRTFTARAELMRLPRKNKRLIAAYDALLDELSSDPAFRADVALEVV